MSSTQEVTNSYLADCGQAPAVIPGMPEYLNLSLRERHVRLERNPQLASEWAEEYADWCAQADSQYRCFVSTRQVDAPWYRLGVKDTVDVAGFPTRLGLRHYRHYPKRSAEALTQLDPRIAITCKVASTELNIGFGAGCRNPRFPTIDPSGSSTGSAVAVAANLCDIALGTDVLGSVRWPASHCGMVGLRMTHKPTSLGGVFPLSPRMDALGWMTRSADDLEFLFSMLGIEALLGHQLPTKDTYQIGFLTHAYDHDLTSKQMLGFVRKVSS